MEGLSEVARQGILGALLVAAILAIAYLYKHGIRFQKECADPPRSDRIGDWKEIAETVKANSMVMRDWVAANESRTRAIEATVKAQEIVAVAHQNLASEVNRLSSTISSETDRFGEIVRDAAKSNREVREAVLRSLDQRKNDHR
jgi:hypothetical protein